MIAATAECTVIFLLSPGQAWNAPEGPRLLTELGTGFGTLRRYHGQGIPKAMGRERCYPTEFFTRRAVGAEPLEHDKVLRKTQ